MLRAMKLYNYFRSSASFRVRIALELKGLPYEYLPVHLVKGEHKSADYAAVSASGATVAIGSTSVALVPLPTVLVSCSAPPS